LDTLSKERRSWNMSQIKGGDTAAEIKLRSLLHRAGYRFRKNDKRLPGKPDIVLPRYRTVVFVNGCFWHRHPGCKFAYTPKSRVDFWTQKFDATVERDILVRSQLENSHWQVLTVWECDLAKKPDDILRELDSALSRSLVTLGSAQ